MKQIEGNHSDYLFQEGPAPIGAKSFGFDGVGQLDAKLACIAYSATIPNPIRGIDIKGNYWCASERNSRRNLLSSRTFFDNMSVDEHLVAADAHLGEAMRSAKNEQTRESIRQAQFALDDVSTREQRY